MESRNTLHNYLMRIRLTNGSIEVNRKDKAEEIIEKYIHCNWFTMADVYIIKKAMKAKEEIE